jgi:hypothetical protein
LIFDLGAGLASARGETLMVVDSWASVETRSGGFTPGKRLFMWDHVTHMISQLLLKINVKSATR